jgi:simple sugar transport system ATP-binding protein
MSDQKPILEAKGLSKRFGGIHAVDGVDFSVYEKEIVAIVGDNGAGKSTLVKLISGVHEKTAGEIYVGGERAEIRTPLDAKSYGIETVYQTDSLIRIIDAPSNIFLGRERIVTGPIGRVLRILDYKFMRNETQKLLAQFGIDLKDLSADVGELSGGQAQTVAIGRAIYWGGRILFLDEPTNNLGVVQERKVLELIKQLRDQFNMTIIVISHNLRHVFELVDRIIVLRNGQKVADLVKAETSTNEVVSYITGVGVREPETRA